MKVNKKGRNWGVSLIEVLISLLLLSIVLFGLDAGQIYANKELKNAYFFSTGINQMHNAIERLLTLRDQTGLEQQIASWNKENQIVLPEGLGTITGRFPDYLITLSWGNASEPCVKQQIGSTGCLIQKIQLA